MVSINKEGVLLTKTILGFENTGVLNPAVIKQHNTVHMFYRAVSKGNYSTIGYCCLEGPTKVVSRIDSPILFPQFEYEKHGVEDPRIVKIEDTFYLTYTAYDGLNALGALATSTDLVIWEKKGLIVPQITYKAFLRLAETKGTINEKYIRYNEYAKIQKDQTIEPFVWDKNVILFPRKIKGKFYMLHRVRPDIQIVCFEKFEELNTDFWQKYFMGLDNCIVMTSKYEHEVSYIGGGCPPIETEFGWLIIYHGVHDTIKGYVYSACAALLDLENPQKEISRLSYPLFSPNYMWEMFGEVNNVCFPTGAALFGDKLYIYYGAADEQIGVVSLSLSELINELKPINHDTEF